MGWEKRGVGYTTNNWERFGTSFYDFGIHSPPTFHLQLIQRTARTRTPQLCTCSCSYSLVECFVYFFLLFDSRVDNSFYYRLIVLLLVCQFYPLLLRFLRTFVPLFRGRECQQSRTAFKCTKSDGWQRKGPACNLYLFFPCVGQWCEYAYFDTIDSIQIQISKTKNIEIHLAMKVFVLYRNAKIQIKCIEIVSQFLSKTLQLTH